MPARILWAVLKDLWLFVLSKNHHRLERTEATQTQGVIPSADSKTLSLSVSKAVSTVSLPPKSTTQSTQFNTTQDTVNHPPAHTILAPATDSVVCVSNTQVWATPTYSFDSVLHKVSYGTSVQTTQRSGRFVQVTNLNQEGGWVLHEHLARSVDVWPLLRHREQYDASNEMTIRLRSCITDEFAAASTALSLQAEEYVTYGLWRKGRRLPWLQTHGRVAGSWHRKLKGVEGVHIDVLPKTGSVMEYIIDDIGYVALVEAVTPEQEIHISAVGLFHEGVYEEIDFDLSQWQALQPVFISVA